MRGPQKRVWCDASVDVTFGIAFGAFFSRGMRYPTVCRLQKLTSVEAELETILLAVWNSPRESMIMTDLSEIKHYLENWSERDYIVQLRRALQNKRSFIRYCPPKWRSELYHKCHTTARTSMIRQRKLEASNALEELSSRKKRSNK